MKPLIISGSDIYILQVAKKKLIDWYSQWKKPDRANEANFFRDNEVNVGSRCLIDYSVFCDEIMQVKHFRDDELFCSVGADEVFVETILDSDI